MRRDRATGPWILRATLDNRSLYQLVHSLAVGTFGDVFLVNPDGVYQTLPRSGEVLGQSGIEGATPHGEIRDERVDAHRERLGKFRPGWRGAGGCWWFANPSGRS